MFSLDISLSVTYVVTKHSGGLQVSILNFVAYKLSRGYGRLAKMTSAVTSRSATNGSKEVLQKALSRPTVLKAKNVLDKKVLNFLLQL